MWHSKVMCAYLLSLLSFFSSLQAQNNLTASPSPSTSGIRAKGLVKDLKGNQPKRLFISVEGIVCLFLTVYACCWKNPPREVISITFLLLQELAFLFFEPHFWHTFKKYFSSLSRLTLFNTYLLVSSLQNRGVFASLFAVDCDIEFAW